MPAPVRSETDLVQESVRGATGWVGAVLCRSTANRIQLGEVWGGVETTNQEPRTGITAAVGVRVGVAVWRMGSGEHVRLTEGVPSVAAAALLGLIVRYSGPNGFLSVMCRGYIRREILIEQSRFERALPHSPAAVTV